MIVNIIIGLLSGAVGGNLAGAVLSKFSMGTLWNSVVGILGGGIGAQILSMLGLDISGIIGSLAGGAAGGGALMAIIGIVKNIINK